jgi:hypothetical protein
MIKFSALYRCGGCLHRQSLRGGWIDFYVCDGCGEWTTAIYSGPRAVKDISLLIRSRQLRDLNGETIKLKNHKDPQGLLRAKKILRRSHG